MSDVFSMGVRLFLDRALVGRRVTVGDHSPIDGYQWSIIDRGGRVLVLCHDICSAIGWFEQLENFPDDEFEVFWSKLQNPIREKPEDVVEAERLLKSYENLRLCGFPVEAEGLLRSLQSQGECHR